MRKLKLLLVLCLVAIAASAGTKTVYLSPGVWNAEGARYAICLLTTPNQKWVDFTDYDGDGLFTATIDDSAPGMILCRMNGTTTDNDWANKWDQTQDLAIPFIDGLTYTINNFDGDGGKSGYTISGSNNTYLYNVGANAYLEAGASWGTHATLESPGFTLDVSLSNGKYVIATPKYNGSNHWFNGNGYVDSDWTEWTYTPVDGQNAGTLQAGNEGNFYVLAASGKYNVTRSADAPTTNMGWWRFVTDTKRNDVSGATQATPVELTHKINNPRFDDDANGWTGDAPSRGGNTGGTNGDADSFDDRNPVAEHFSKNFDTYQTLTDLPNGFYDVSVQGFYREGGHGAGPAGEKHKAGTESLNAILYANSAEQPLVSIFAGAGGATGGGTSTVDGIEGAVPNDMAAASYFFSAGLYWNTVRVAVTDGTLKIGIKKETTVTNDWTIFDNFRVQYLGGVCNSAIPLPQNGSIKADQWYKYEVAITGDYIITAGTAADIIQTNNGIQFEDEATGTAITTGTVALTAGTVIYYKSTSDNTLTVEPAEYEYEVSEATTDIAYIQPGNTVTVSFTATTNSGEALTQDYSGVTFAGADIECTPTLSGFTFTVPADVTAGQTYTLAIPANAIGYTNGDTFNAAQNITLTTPVAFDGTYFFKVENDGALKGRYLARGLNYGTHATIDKYGLAIKVATDGQNKSTLKPFDTDRFYRMANTYDCWADASNNDDNAKFNLVTSNGHILIHGCSNEDAEDYFKYNDGDIAETTKIWGDSHSGSSASAVHVLEFSLESAADHATAMQALKDGQAASAAAAAFASGNYASLEGITTVAALEAELTANYIQGDFVAPSSIESISEKYQGGQPGSDNVAEIVYSNTINITEPGFYKFSMQAFYRAGSNDVTQAMHTAGVDFPPVVLFFGNSETQIKSIYDEGGLDQGIAEGYYEQETVGGNPVQYNGKWYTNGQHNSVIIFQKDYYHNDVWFYASEPGTYSYGVKYLGYANANMQWFIYSPESVTITSYAAAADATDYENLANAIAAYDNAVWGFEEGEYAPYNNAEARANIAAAKALDKEATNSKLLVNSLIANIALKANNTEVNAFYDGDFSECAEDNASPLDYTPAGWSASNNMRMMLKNTETYPGLSDASATSAMMSWSGGVTYGETVGYEMPLKANTTYVLKLKAAGWNNETRSGITVSVLNAEDGLAATDLGTPNRDIKGNEHNTAGMTSYIKYFKTGAAGNYVFHVQSGNNMVLTDFDLRRPTNVYAVAGSNADIFSGEWDQATQTDYLELNGNEYTKTYSDLTLDKQTIEFKVIKKERVESTSAINNDSWYPANNVQISIPVKGIYNITITFNGNEASPVVTGVPTKTAEAVTIGESGWATTVTNSALDFSAVPEVEAYTATVDGSTVILEQVDDVQAETGLVLKGDEDTYFVPVIAESETEKGSLMYSSTDTYNTWGSYNFYGLHINETSGKAQFALIDRSDGEQTIPAGKAFLMLGAATARELTIVFGDETTGISNLNAETGAEGIYNLNGQRVNAPSKGLYIVNGKKVVKK